MPDFDFQTLDETDVEAGGNRQAPAVGTFEAVCEDARAFRGNDGNSYVVFDFRVVSGPHADYQWGELRAPGEEAAYKALKGLCNSLGVDTAGVTGLDDFDARVKKVKGRFFKVTAKEKVTTKGTFINSYFDPISSPTPASDVPSDTSSFAPSPTAPDSSTPF